MIMKCKPTWNFQSIEFEVEVDDNCEAVADQDLKNMFDLYDKILKGLQKISPVQDQKSPAPKTQDPPATQKQKDVMDLYGIDYPDNVTSKQAQALIQKSMRQG